MALTLEAALVFPLTISLVIGIVPPAIRSYRQIAAEASLCRQAARLTADPDSLYRLAPLSGAAGAGGNGGSSGGSGGNNGSGAATATVLLTSPKQMLVLMTAILDDLEILGLAKP